jgi:hypothetical protein
MSPATAGGGRLHATLELLACCQAFIVLEQGYFHYRLRLLKDGKLGCLLTWDPGGQEHELVSDARLRSGGAR